MCVYTYFKSLADHDLQLELHAPRLTVSPRGVSGGLLCGAVASRVCAVRGQGHIKNALFTRNTTLEWITL